MPRAWRKGACGKASPLPVALPPSPPQSAWSGDVPGAPTGLTVTDGHRAVELHWTAAADGGGSPITGYEIAGSTGVPGDGLIATGSTSTSYIVDTGQFTGIWTLRAGSAAWYNCPIRISLPVVGGQFIVACGAGAKAVSILGIDHLSVGNPEYVPFPLYHGTSSHYMANFRPGESLSVWPYIQDVLHLYRSVWTALRRFGQAPEWWQEKILAQDSGHANWQHGQLYVTPSKGSAVGYAGGGAAHGGELLQLCRNAIDELVKFDRGKPDEIVEGATSVAQFLEETGSPVLIEFSNVQICGLSPERASDDVSAQLANLASLDERMREIMGQQVNFRLAPGCGVVGRVFDLTIDDIGNPLSQFQCREIVDRAVWGKA